jgi:N-acetylneuraminate synthase/N,N'-diacetyllegionaminate synthase
MGAEILEFHFTDDRTGKTFRDHKVSLTPDEIAFLINEVRDIECLQGSGIKEPLEIEKDHVISFRRAIYPKRDLKKGAVLTEDDLIALRPNHGIDAREYDRLLGKRLLEDVRAHQKLTWNMVQ